MTDEAEVATTSDLRLSEVVAALSYALDITDGQPLGHAVRSCAIGMRLASELDLPASDRTALFYGLLLKDAGCSSNAAKITALYGTDDFAAKADVKTVNHSNIGEALRYIRRNAAGITGLVRVLRAGAKTARQMTEIRCERGAEIARMVGAPEDTARAIYSLDEHWDGKGHPQGLEAAEIPLLARIMCLSQTVEVFHGRFGVEAAFETAAARAGTWFDPRLVAALEATRCDDEFWSAIVRDDIDDQVLALEPTDRMLGADEARLDRIAAAFARVIDAKSPYTARHSQRVAQIAVAIGGELGLDPLEIRDLRRAALLHDLGKLAVSNLILDKPGSLTGEEIAAVRRHPEHTQAILARVAAFRDLAETAAAHHERVDGSGYPHGLTGDDLGLSARILAVSDVFEALTSDRPYRAALSTDEALDVVCSNALCPDAVAALHRVAPAFA